jgi:DNA mismatch endonuclease (patch repair protein)
VRPVASSEVVRRQMARQRTSGTAPEIALRRELHALGLRFRVHLKVGAARPDVVLTKARIAVFVMGDFWHSCPLHGTRPKANAAWWAAKLEANRIRDERQRHELEAAGWHVTWVWECEDPAVAAAAVWTSWRRRVTA